MPYKVKFAFYIQSIIISLLLLSTSSTVFAIDTNEDLVGDPEVKALYLRATKTWFTKEGMKKGDSLRVIGEKRKDRAILALAAEVKENYMYQNGTKQQYYNASMELLQAMKRAGLMYQYFCALYSAIIYDCNHDNTIGALRRAIQMQKDAVKYQDRRIMLISLRSNGIVYNMRGNYQLAIEYYQKAINYSNSHLKGKYLDVIYSDLSSLYYSNHEYEKGVEAANMVIEKARGNAEMLVDGYSRRCHNLYELNRIDDFMKDYAKLEALLKQFPEFAEYTECVWSKALYLVLKGQKDEARKLIYALETTEDSIDVNLTIALRDGDYKNAYYLNEKYRDYMQNEENKLDQNEIIEMSSELGMAQLQQEAAELKASHQRMVYLTIIVVICAILAVFIIEVILGIRRRKALQRQKIIEERELIQTHYKGNKTDDVKKETETEPSSANEEQKPKPRMDNGEGQVLVAEINKVIDENMTSGDITVPFLADELATSVSTLNRKLKGITGMSATIYIRARRMAKAKQLLATTDKSVTEIETLCGYNTPGYFSKMFKAETGISPSDYRRQMLLLNS